MASYRGRPPLHGRQPSARLSSPASAEHFSNPTRSRKGHAMTRIDNPRTSTIGSAGNEGRNPYRRAGPSFHSRSNRRSRAHRPRRRRPGLPPLRARSRPGRRAGRGQGGRPDRSSRCDYATENGSYAADCGTLVVPENRADPESRLIALPVTRIRATVRRSRRSRSSASQAAPASSNMDSTMASRFADDHDVVLVGYRGVDGSSRLDCPEVESALKRLDRLPRREVLPRVRRRVPVPAPTGSPTTASISPATAWRNRSTISRPRASRSATTAINLLSESAGTRTAMIYSWRYPRASTAR